MHQQQQLQQQQRDQQLQQQRDQQIQLQHHHQVQQSRDQQKLQQQRDQQLQQQHRDHQLRRTSIPLTVKCEVEELWGRPSGRSPRSRSPLNKSPLSLTSSRHSPLTSGSNTAASSQQLLRPHFPPPAGPAASLPPSSYAIPKTTFGNLSPLSGHEHGLPRLDLPADENIQLEELEEFAKEFKQRRIKLGYTQVI